MLQYDTLENLILYRQPLAIPRTEKNKGMCILLNSPNQLEVTKFLTTINTRYRNSNYIKAYYKDFRYKFKVFGKSVIEKVDVDEVYKDINVDSEQILKTFRMLASHANNNIFIDLSHYNELFFKMQGKITGSKVIDEYTTLMNSTISIYPYVKKIMVLDLQQWNLDLKSNKIYSYINANNPFTILYSLMIRNIEIFKTIPFDILIVDGKYSIKVIPSLCDTTSASILKSNIAKIKNVNSSDILQDEDDMEVTVANKIDTKITKVISHSFTGVDKVKELTTTIEEVTKEVVAQSDSEDDEVISDEVEEKLNLDKEFLSKLDMLTTNSYTNFTANDLKRNKLLAEKQATLQVNKEGKTIKQILDKSKAKQITPKTIKSRSTNTNMQEMKLPVFTKNYNEKLLDSDTIAILNFFKDKRVPVYILDIQKEDTSNTFDKKFTYTIKMESGDRIRHTVKFDMPKFINDSFMYLGNNKKTIINQLFLKPVSKTNPDTVQMCSNYNKIFVRRSGSKISPKMERLKKALLSMNGINIRSKVFYKPGNNTLTNTGYLSNMEYDELGNNYNHLYINGGLLHFFFNQEDIRNYISEAKLKFTNSDTILPIAIKNKKEIIYMDVEKDVIVGTKLAIIDYIIEELNNCIPKFKEDFNTITVGKKFIYSEATIMKKKVPLLLLLSYLEGLTKVLNKAEIKYYFSDNRDRLTDDDKSNKEIIQFADGYLIYDRYPMQNSLLLNAFALIPTKNYNYADFDNKEVYLELFNNMYGNKMILNAFENFYDLFIDPITLEVLEDLKLPTDFVSLAIYASSLLQDNQYIKESDLSLYRLRNNEIVNVYLYKVLANSYSVYRGSASNKNPIKMSIPQDAVIKEILMANNIEDYSTLNPVLEAEKLRATSFKGPAGLNMERAYTIEKRSYDKSMKGIIAMSSPPSGSVGVVKQLATDVNILSPRGYLKIIDNIDELNSANMFCPSELLTPGIAQHDDTSRVSMATSQAKHVVPADGYDELLITNGADDILPQIISNDFAFKAKEDGQVIEYDEESKVLVLKYKSGTIDIIDAGNNISKNGGGLNAT